MHVTAHSLVKEGEKDGFSEDSVTLCNTRHEKPMIKGLRHEYQNTTGIKIDSIKVTTIRHILIIAPN